MVSPRRLFLLLLVPLLAFRLWFAAVLPMTGDEAYFFWWGRIPDWGFYDHPPMVGWWLAAQLLAGDAAWWLRLSAVLLPSLSAAAVLWFVPRIWPGVADERRWWAALLVLLAPANVWNVLITTDTPLTYFSLLSGLCWLLALRTASWRWYLACGVMLAGAVLSKYFAAFLGFAFLVDVVLRPNRRAWAGLLIAYACCVPALAVMAWWNAGHCWPNYMFNFVNRHDDAGLSWQTPILYALSLLYLLTPVVPWALARRHSDNTVERTDGNDTKGVLLIGLVPLLLFGLLSLVKTIGLHWMLSFLPFVFIVFALSVQDARLIAARKFLLGFAALHVIAIVALSLTPLQTWHRLPWYDAVVLAVDAPQITARLEPDAATYRLMAGGYADAVVLGYNAHRYYGVFGPGSSHARHDDILTDFRELDGRNILILRKRLPAPGEYEPYFRQLSTETFVMDGVSFYAIRGRGFEFARYRDDVLATVKRKYYALPAWLPQCGCYFCERYFPGQTCQR